MTTTKSKKPLGGPAYGSIGHLPASRLGPGDHCICAGQARLLCEKTRDKHDRVIVQEKLDGSCVAAANINGAIIPLIRDGYHARTSPYETHHLWADWVETNAVCFKDVLHPGERLCGEWLASAHGTRYEIGECGPFVAFDIIRDKQRVCFDEFRQRVASHFLTPATIWDGPAVTPERAVLIARRPLMRTFTSLDDIEGVIYRLERKGRVESLAKYVVPGKVDGKYLPIISGQPEVWNWRPA